MHIPFSILCDSYSWLSSWTHSYSYPSNNVIPLTLHSTERRKWDCFHNSVVFSSIIIWRKAIVILLYLSLFHWYSYSIIDHIIERESDNLSGVIASENLSHQVIHFENMTFAEQVSSLRFTRVLISIHGAGLSNIIFLQPGSTVIELMHPLLNAPFYRFLSYYASLNYILIKDVKPLNDFCVELHHWNLYFSYNLDMNVT